MNGTKISGYIEDKIQIDNIQKNTKYKMTKYNLDKIKGTK